MLTIEDKVKLLDIAVKHGGVAGWRGTYKDMVKEVEGVKDKETAEMVCGCLDCTRRCTGRMTMVQIVKELDGRN